MVLFFLLRGWTGQVACCCWNGPFSSYLVLTTHSFYLLGAVCCVCLILPVLLTKPEKTNPTKMWIVFCGLVGAEAFLPKLMWRSIELLPMNWTRQVLSSIVVLHWLTILWKLSHSLGDTGKRRIMWKSGEKNVGQSMSPQRKWIMHYLKKQRMDAKGVVLLDIGFPKKVRLRNFLSFL